MADGNGIDFDINIPSNNSSVKDGASEMRNIRNRIRSWAESLFDVAATTATLKTGVISSTALAAPSLSAASFPSVSTGSGDPTFNAVQVNSKGQVIGTKKATLNELATLSGGVKLSTSNLAPSATGGQFLRTDAGATGVEWATNASVSRWDTSQALSFTQVPADTTLNASVNLNAVAFDDTRFAVCGNNRRVRTTREFQSFRDSGIFDVAGTTFADLAVRPAVTTTNDVQVVAVGYDSANGANPCVVWTGAGTAANGFFGGTDRTTTSLPAFSTANLKAVEYGNGFWTFAGNGGVLFYVAQASFGTSGAFTPTQVNTGTAANLYDLKFGGSLFVAVGAGGTILTQPPGGAATLRTSGTTNDLRGITYGFVGASGKYVAVGGAGTVLTSSDGISWAAQPSLGGGVTLNSVDYGNGRFVVVGSNGSIWSSADAVTWTNVSTKVWRSGDNAVGSLAANLNKVSFLSGTWVVVGDSGTILLSGDLPVVGWKEAAPSEAWTTPAYYRIPNALSAVPELTRVSLVNVYAQLGYSPGDSVSLTNFSNNLVFNPSAATFTFTDSAGTSGVSGVVTHGVIQVPNLSLEAGTLTGINPSFWRVRITAVCVS